MSNHLNGYAVRQETEEAPADTPASAGVAEVLRLLARAIDLAGGGPPAGPPLRVTARCETTRALLAAGAPLDPDVAFLAQRLFSPMEREIVRTIGDGALQQKEVRARLDLESETKLRLVLANLVDRRVLVKVTGGYAVADPRLLELARAGGER